jgi:hypothetical protein
MSGTVNVLTADTANAANSKMATDIADLQKRVTALEGGTKPPDPPQPGQPSPDGTTVTTIGPAIIDAALKSFTIVAADASNKGQQIAINGTRDTRTGNVTTLYAKGHTCYQKNTAGSWYSADGATPPNWTQTADPTGVAPPTPTGSFHVANGQVMDSNNQPFIARGIALLDGQMGDHTPAVLMGLMPKTNLFNLANGADNSGYHSAKPNDQIIAWTDAALALGAIVMLSDYQPGQPQVRSGGDLDGAANWYSALAAHYKDQPRVWWTTENEAGGNQSEYHNRIYDTIRNAGNNSMIWMESQNGNATGTGGLNAGDYGRMHNVGWNIHVYPWEYNKGSQNQNDYDNAARSFVQRFQSFANSADGVMPVMMGEGGNSTSGNGVDPDDVKVNNVWACVQSFLNCTGTGSQDFRAYAAWLTDWYGQQHNGDPDTLINIHTNPWSLTDYGRQVANDIAAKN